MSARGKGRKPTLPAGRSADASSSGARRAPDASAAPSKTTPAKQDKPYIERPSGPTPVYVTRPKGDGPYAIPSKESPDLSGIPDFSLRSFPSAPRPTATIEVSPGPGCLSAAISAVADGAVLRVPAGKYRESLRIDKSLTFIANGPVSLRGDGSGETILVTAPYVAFEGFSIKQKVSPTRAAIGVLKGAVFLSNCLVRSRAAASIQLRGDGQAKVINTVVKAAATPAVSLAQSAEIACEASVFEHSKTVAFQVKGSAKASVTQCVFQHSPKGGLSATDSSSVFIDSSRFTNCNVELANDSGVNIIAGSLIEWRDESDPDTAGIVVAQKTRANIVGNRISNHTVDSREESAVAFARNSFVDGSLIVWGKAQSSSTGDHFTGKVPHVAISVTGKATFELSDVEIEGLTGSGVVLYGGEDAPTVTVKGGTIKTVSGSGLTVHTRAVVTVSGLTVENCQQNGVIIRATKSVLIEGVTATGNGAAGVCVHSTEAATLKEIICRDNPGCGLVVAQSKAEVTDSVFSGNGRAGLHVTDGAVAVRDSQFIGNQKGGLVAAGQGVITAGPIEVSENQRGGVIVAIGGTARVVDGTFDENEIAVNVSGTAEFERSVVMASRAFGAQVVGKAKFSAIRFEGNPVALAVSGDGIADVLDETVFVANAIHVQASLGGKVAGRNSTFQESTGSCGVHIAAATGSFTTCKFLNDSTVALFSEGDLSVADCQVEGAGKAGFIFGKGSTGTVSTTKIIRNGGVAAQVQAGAPTISQNEISGHEQYGIYVLTGAHPIVEANNFKNNGLADVWRG